MKKARITLLYINRKAKLTRTKGSYKFAHLHPGTFTVQISAKGYATQTQSITQLTPATISLNIVLNIVANTNATVTVAPT